MQVELEAKFLCVDVPQLRARLAAAGYVLLRPLFTMHRSVFRPADTDAAGRTWGRVRDEGDKITMAIKTVRDADTIDGVLEAEVTIDSFEQAELLLQAAGFQRTAFQETTREAWAQGDVAITIDTWPGLQPFMEIEAPTAEAVLGAAERLGYSPVDAVYGSVTQVYERELGIPREVVNRLPRITFAEPPVWPQA